MLKPPPTPSATNAPPGDATSHRVKRSPPGSGSTFGGTGLMLGGGGGGGISPMKIWTSTARQSAESSEAAASHPSSPTARKDSTRSMALPSTDCMNFRVESTRAKDKFEFAVRFPNFDAYPTRRILYIEFEAAM